MIQNKTTAIILAVLTFILSSFLLVILIFYFFGYPLSSLAEHQIYVFFAILIGVLLASMVYGRGSKERASTVTKILKNSLGIKVKEKDVYQVLRTIEQLPPFVVQKYISLNINAVKESEDKIENYKSKLTEENLLIIRKIIETPVEELQKISNEIYLQTKMEQFKFMAEPVAKPLIELNIQELKRVLLEG